MNVYGCSNYRDILCRRFTERQVENPGYSMRDFARDLGMAVSSLSEVLSGKHGLSQRSAASLAVHLGLGANERRFFCDLVESEHGRSQQGREMARSRLTLRRTASHLDADQFNLISEWYHLAILELMTTRGFKHDIDWIASTLGISRMQADMAIQRMTRLGLLSCDNGRFKVLKSSTTTTDDVPSVAIRRFQSEILEKARHALNFQSVEEREIASVVVSIRKDDLPAARKMIKEFRRMFCGKLEQSGPGDEVYCFSTALFRLQKNVSDAVARNE